MTRQPLRLRMLGTGAFLALGSPLVASEDTGYLDAYLNADRSDPLAAAKAESADSATDPKTGITPAGGSGPEGTKKGGGDSSALDPGSTAEALAAPGDSWIDKLLDPIWTVPLIYENEDNPYIQGAHLSGQLHYQTGDVNSDFGDLKDSEIRRARIGAHLRMFYHIDIDAELNFADDTGDGLSYEGIDTFAATLHVTDNFRAQIGKLKPQWSHEWKTDAHDLFTLERAQMINQVRPDKTAGIYLSGEWEQWSYGLGVYSGERDRRGLGNYNFSDKRFWVMNLGYEFIDPEAPDVTERWHFDYLYNEDSKINETVPDFQHMIATGVTVESERMHFLAEVLYVNGQSNMWGLTLEPSYFLIPRRLQLVGRYHYSDSDDSNAIVFQDRYASNAPMILDQGRGDEFHSIYLGLNYYFYRNNIKLMTGLEYSILRETDGNDGEYKGWSWLTGMRMSF